MVGRRHPLQHKILVHRAVSALAELLACLRFVNTCDCTVINCCVEGVQLATKRHCKFVEISALLDHKVDELLVGIVRQIRLRQTRDKPLSAYDGTGGGSGGRLATALSGMLRRLMDRATTPTRRRPHDVKSRPSLAECNNLFTPWLTSLEALLWLRDDCLYVVTATFLSNNCQRHAINCNRP